MNLEKSRGWFGRRGRELGLATCVKKRLRLIGGQRFVFGLIRKSLKDLSLNFYPESGRAMHLMALQAGNLHRLGGLEIALELLKPFNAK